MRLTVRQRKIFEVLWSVRDYVTVKFISQQIAFSEKTIRGDLDSIKNAIDDQQIGKLIAKTNKGFYLDIERAAYEKIAANHISIEPLRRIKNRTHSLLILLLNCDAFSLQDLADSIYLDKRSLKKYYDEAEEWLAKINITIIKQDALYQLNYQESDLRRGLWDLFTEIKSAYKTDNDSDGEFLLSASKKYHIDTADIYGLNILFKKEMGYFPQLQMIINDCELRSNYKYTYDAYIWILFSSLVLLQRHRHPIVSEQYLSSPLLAEVGSVHQSAMAIGLLNGLNGITRFTLNHSEVTYLTACLLCAEYSAMTGSDIGDESASEQAMVSCLKAFIVSLSHVVGAEIAKDKRLLQRLFYLIHPMIYRHRFGLKSDLSHASRALVRQVKSSYLDLFLEVELCCEIFNQRYFVTLSEIDMSLITLCIRNTQSSAVKKIRISIVCNHGMGISYFISQKIQRAISQVEIIDVLSLREIDRLTSNNSDLVICTMPLEASAYQVIQVNDTLMPYDLSLIKQTVKKMQKLKTLQSVVNMKEIKGFHKFIHPEMVFISDYQDKYQALESITQRAEGLNLCEQQYLLSVLDREKAAPTQIGPGVVLTHGYPDWVKNNFISISLLTKPVLWSDDFNVDIIIMVGLKKSANGKFASCIAEFYSMLAALLENDELMKTLRSCNTNEALFDFFVNINNLRNIYERDRNNYPR